MPNKRSERRARGKRRVRNREKGDPARRGGSGFRGYVADVKSAYDQWVEHDGTMMASAVAYYMALSFFPLLLVLISGLGLFFRLTHLGQDAERQVFQIISQHFSLGLEQQVRNAFAQVREGAAFNGPVGVIALLLSAMAVFAQVERAFERIWEAESGAATGMIASIKEVIFGRFRAFLMLLSLAVLMLAIFIVGIVLSGLQRYTEGTVPGVGYAWWVAEIGVNVLLNAGVFTLIYRALSKGPVRWREALQGGLLAAFVWEIGRQILSSYLVGSRYDSAYGVVGSFIAVMLWVYYGVTVLFLGAEYVHVLCRRSESAERKSF